MKGKKSFILYCDLIATVGKLPDEAAGRLFKTILEYVNDLNPEVNDLLLQIAFEPIKQQLKRDLMDWHDERQSRSESGRIGGLKSAEARSSKPKQTQAPLASALILEEKPINTSQANPSTASKIEAKQAVTVNVTDTVTENVNVTVTHNSLVFEIMKYFGFTEIRNPNRLSDIAAFLNSLGDGKIEYFKTQFSWYQKYKSESGEKIHSFPSFIEGKWEQENWEHKYKEFKKTSSVMSNKTPPTDQVYIPIVKKAGRTPEEYAEFIRADRERLEKLRSEFKPSQEPPIKGTFLQMKDQLDKIAPKP